MIQFEPNYKDGLGLKSASHTHDINSNQKRKGKVFANMCKRAYFIGRSGGRRSSESLCEVQPIF